MSSVKISPKYARSVHQQSIAHFASWSAREPMASLLPGFSSPNQAIFKYCLCGFQLYCWALHKPSTQKYRLQERVFYGRSLLHSTV